MHSSQLSCLYTKIIYATINVEKRLMSKGLWVACLARRFYTDTKACNSRW